MFTDQIRLNETSLLNEWSLDQNFPDEMRFVDLNIHLKYTDVDSLSEFEPKERKRLIAKDHREKFNKLIQINLFHDYKLIGTVYRPLGIQIRIAFSALKEIEHLDFVGGISIKKLMVPEKRGKESNLFSIA